MSPYWIDFSPASLVDLSTGITVFIASVMWFLTGPRAAA